MWVKICANTNLGDARLAAELGAEAVGFVFAPSKRQVTAGQVGAITAELPEKLVKVGVFATRDAEEILRGVAVAGLNAVQLHSAYHARLIDELHARTDGRLILIQVVSVEIAPDASEDFEAGVRKQLEPPFLNPVLRAVLLDAAHGGASGGLGRSFPWERVAPVLHEVRTQAQKLHRAAGTSMPELILAGGLRPENVAEAIRTLEPDGVDVASGVEAEPGRKDPRRVEEFLRAAKAAG